MKLGTVKTEHIAAVQVKTLGWTQKIASLKKLSLFLFFSLISFFCFFLFIEVSISVPGNLHPA